jgi:hypothetical protein
MNIGARLLNLNGARFSAGGRVDASGSLDLRGLSSQGPILVTGPTGAESMPQVLSIRGADAGPLTLGAVDMSSYLFYGAHNSRA